MKANELRIGNYVNRVESLSDDKLGIVCFSENDWYRIGECIDSLEYYKPIPLTEDILLRFSERKNNLFEIGKFDYSLEDKKFYIYPNSWDCVPCEINCEYLHQLQNLYLDLTDEELTIPNLG